LTLVVLEPLLEGLLPVLVTPFLLTLGDRDEPKELGVEGIVDPQHGEVS
jgi:hypothetical protein